MWDRIAHALNRGALRPAAGYGLIVAAIVATVALLTCAGCGASALRTNALVATAMHEVQVEAGPAIRAARRDAMIAAAQRVADAGGSRAEAEAAAAAEALRWACAVDGERLFGSALSIYIEAMVLARETDAEFSIARGLVFVGPILDSYRPWQTCLVSLGSDALPEVPAFLDLFPPAWSSR